MAISAIDSFCFPDALLDLPEEAAHRSSKLNDEFVEAAGREAVFDVAAGVVAFDALEDVGDMTLVEAGFEAAGAMGAESKKSNEAEV